MECYFLAQRKELCGEVAKHLFNNRPDAYQKIAKVNSAKDLEKLLQERYIVPGKYPIGFVMIDTDNDDRFVAFAAVSLNGKFPEIKDPWLTDVYVVPEYRGLGAGERLIRCVMDFMANKQKCTKMYLWTDIPKLKGYYKDLGFDVIMRRKECEGFKFDIMAADLYETEESLIKPVHVTGLIVIIMLIILFKGVLRFIYRTLFNWRMTPPPPVIQVVAST